MRKRGKLKLGLDLIGNLERRVKISFYLLAWQGVLMFLMGIVCVLASFGGYLLSGGGEELLRRALLNVTSGRASYDSLELNWRTGMIEVTNIRHEDFSWPKIRPIAELKNIQAEKLFVKLEGWPARVESITLQGLTGVPMNDGSGRRARPTITVNDGFLQQGEFPDQNPPRDLPRIQFVDCELDVKLSDTVPLQMSGCKGEMARDSEGRLRGGFSLNKLNDKPFELTLESLEDGRWVVTGKKIQLDTRAALAAARNPFASKIDPVGLLIKSLFSGEMGAHGTLTSLHVAVLPARDGQPFSCDGEVGYTNLTLKLPSAADKSRKALPFYMGMLLGVDEKQTENLWPPWMHVDQITTGALGRVTFHMADGRLDFGCDEGAGSAFTGVREGLPFPALESLKGSVETDASSLPKRIVLRGFIGSEISFETRIVLGDDRSRTTELLVLPRSSDAAQLNFGRPLWRFESRVKDYVSVPDRPANLALAEFEVESTIQSFPVAEWLPAGLKQFTGRIHAKGGFHNLDGKPEKGRTLRLDKLSWTDGGAVFGGPTPGARGSDFDPSWDAFYAIFATAKPWTLHGIATQAAAELNFDSNFEWNGFRLNAGTVQSAVLEQGGELSVFAPPELKLACECKRDPATEAKTAEVSAAGADWNVTLKGLWIHDKVKPPSGEFNYSENNVPLKIHPLRTSLAPASIKGDRAQREIGVSVRADGVKVEGK